MRIFIIGFSVAIVTMGCGQDETTGCEIKFSEADSPDKSVVINEVMAKSVDGTPDWIELYNSGSAEADLSCFSVVDKSSKHLPYFIAPGTTLPPGGFYVLTRDKDGATGFTWGFGNADVAILKDPEGRLADTTGWEAGQAQAGNSWGRSPDGSGAFATLLEATKGAANAQPDPNPPLLPEG